MTTGAPQSATPDENDGRSARRQQDPSTTSPSESHIARIGQLSPGQLRKIRADSSHPDHAAFRAWDARRSAVRKRVLQVAPAARPVRIPRQPEIRVVENADQARNAVAVRARRRKRFQWWVTYVVGPLCGIVGAVAAVVAIAR
jgi:hypothetical protein